MPLRQVTKLGKRFGCNVAVDSGSISLAGQKLVGLKPRQIWKQGVGRTFQTAETFASLTVAADDAVRRAYLSM